ncbi:MAG TPA: LysM peptidoglycan-binding domain-containing protein [Chthoniobacterales bacterium]|jgi:LysM repeat protein
MIRCRHVLVMLAFNAALTAAAFAQEASPAGTSEATQLLNLSRKIDQQNVKIDLLSQQILRLQQEIEHPGAGATATAPRATETSIPAAAAVPNGRTHVVAKGETLTSIAKMHKVTIGELQKLNHIEDDRKLQIGQTLLLPGATGSAVSPSPGSSPNE